MWTFGTLLVLTAVLVFASPSAAYAKWERREVDVDGQKALVFFTKSTDTVSYDGETKRGSLDLRCDGPAFSLKVSTLIEPQGSSQQVRFRFDRWHWDTDKRVKPDFWAFGAWNKQGIVNLVPESLDLDLLDSFAHATRFDFRFVAARDAKTYEYSFDLRGFTKALKELRDRCGASMPKPSASPGSRP